MIEVMAPPAWPFRIALRLLRLARERARGGLSGLERRELDALLRQANQPGYPRFRVFTYAKRRLRGA